MEKTEITKTEILEEGSFYTLFNKGIATYLESFAFVVIIMFSLTIFQVIETFTLLNRILPIQNLILRWLASFSLANTIEFTQLKFSIHSDKVGKYTHILLGITSLVLNVFFFEAWADASGDNFWTTINQTLHWNREANLIEGFIKLFFSFFIAFLTFKYADLYIQKRTEHDLKLSFNQLLENLSLLKLKISGMKEKETELQKLETKINQTQTEQGVQQTKLNQLHSYINQKEKQFEQLTTDYNLKVTEKESLTTEINQLLTELEKWRLINSKVKTYADNFFCPKCGESFVSKQKRDEHVKLNRCKK